MGYLTNIRRKRYYVEENQDKEFIIPFGGGHPIIIEARKTSVYHLI